VNIFNIFLYFLFAQCKLRCLFFSLSPFLFRCFSSKKCTSPCIRKYKIDNIDIYYVVRTLDDRHIHSFLHEFVDCLGIFFCCDVLTVLCPVSILFLHVARILALNVSGF